MKKPIYSPRIFIDHSKAPRPSLSTGTWFTIGFVCGIMATIGIVWALL